MCDACINRYTEIMRNLAPDVQRAIEEYITTETETNKAEIDHLQQQVDDAEGARTTTLARLGVLERAVMPLLDLEEVANIDREEVKDALSRCWAAARER